MIISKFLLIYPIYFYLTSLFTLTVPNVLFLLFYKTNIISDSIFYHNFSRRSFTLEKIQYNQFYVY
jgi:hypothetical protein